MKYSILFIYQGSVIFGKQEHSIHIHFRWNWILCFLFIDERKTYLWLDITAIHQGCISKSPRINVFRKKNPKQTQTQKQKTKQKKKKRKTQDNMHYFKDLTANIFRSDSCFSKIEIKKKIPRCRWWWSRTKAMHFCLSPLIEWHWSCEDPISTMNTTYCTIYALRFYLLKEH